MSRWSSVNITLPWYVKMFYCAKLPEVISSHVVSFPGKHNMCLNMSGFFCIFVTFYLKYALVKDVFYERIRCLVRREEVLPSFHFSSPPCYVGLQEKSITKLSFLRPPGYVRHLAMTRSDFELDPPLLSSIIISISVECHMIKRMTHIGRNILRLLQIRTLC